MFNATRILVLAPHTDDGELGCGGTIAKLCAEGKEVFYAGFSICNRSLPAGFEQGTLEIECRKATTALGIDSRHLTLFDFEVREFSSFRQQILDQMIHLKSKIQPEIIFIPSANDVHQDHEVIHKEALRAFKHTTILCYELPWNHTHFQPAVFVSLSREEVKKKVSALSLYASQRHRSYMNDDFIYSQAKFRGVQSGAAFAEAFEATRIITS